MLKNESSGNLKKTHKWRKESSHFFQAKNEWESLPLEVKQDYAIRKVGEEEIYIYFKERETAQSSTSSNLKFVASSPYA